MYKGKLHSGRFAVVKLLRQEKTKGLDFINEVVATGRIHHCNMLTHCMHTLHFHTLSSPFNLRLKGT